MVRSISALAFQDGLIKGTYLKSLWALPHQPLAAGCASAGVTAGFTQFLAARRVCGYKGMRGLHRSSSVHRVGAWL